MSEKIEIKEERIARLERECAESYYHHGSTTGIVILNHPKREQILDILKRNNWLDVSFALHGGKENHNKPVNNDAGLEAIVSASKMFKDAGFQVYVSLIVSLQEQTVLQRIDEKQLKKELFSKGTAFFYINNKLDYF